MPKLRKTPTSDYRHPAIATPTATVPKLPLKGDRPTKTGAAKTTGTRNTNINGSVSKTRASHATSDGLRKIYEDVVRHDRKQMTFQVLAEEVRLRKEKVIVGFVSAVIRDMGIVKLHSKGQFMLGEEAEAEPEARKILNPRAIGCLVDETGSLSGEHNLIVERKAWEDLLGGSIEVLGGFGTSRLLEDAEERLKYARMTFVFLWTGRKSRSEHGDGKLVLMDVLP